MFDELKEPVGHFAVRGSMPAIAGGGQTTSSILVSCGARLAPFDIGELRELTAYDELELDTLGDRKGAPPYFSYDTATTRLTF